MTDKLKKLDYENSLFMIARNATKSLERSLDSELLRTHGLSSAQWKVVAALAVRTGLSQKELADILSIDSSTLVPVIDKLEQNQFLKRKPDPNDRRHNRLFLTAKSESILDSIVDAILNLRKSVYKNISVRDIEITKKVLRVVTENAESFTSEGSADSKNKIRKNR